MGSSSSHDERTLLQKLQAMAAQTASPHEAAVARGLLEKLQKNRGRTETPRVLTRDEILAAPDRPDVRQRRYLKVRYQGLDIVVDEDEYSLIFGRKPLI